MLGLVCPATLQGTIFKNAVLTSTSFDGANVEGADFTEVRTILTTLPWPRMLSIAHILLNVVSPD